MPVKILLADKSITIQKVVEMLFSGKEYEVACVSDGDSALAEASRSAPDVVLADVDLPRIDGYSLAARFKMTPAFAQTPVILMLSRDDAYDAARGKQAGIVDNIAKPFESQELIGKVKKALTGAPKAAPAAAPAAARPAAPPPRPEPPAAPPPPKPKPAAPRDIFDIIEEAPTQTELKAPPAPVVEKTPEPQPRMAPAPPAPSGEELFEVEPELELEAEIIEEPPRAVPSPPKPAPPPPPKATTVPEPAPPAPEPFFEPEIEEEKQPLFVVPERPARKPEPPKAAPVFEEAIPVTPEPEFAPAARAAAEDEEQLFGPAATEEPLTAEAEKALPFGEKAVEEMREGLGFVESGTAAQSEIVSFESLDMASRNMEEYAPPPREEERVIPPPAREEPLFAPERPARPAPAVVTAPPQASEEMLRGVAHDVVERLAREVLERVAWEVIPALAEQMIREEIEKLKTGK